MVANNFLTFPSLALPILQRIDANVQKILTGMATEKNQETILDDLQQILDWTAAATSGSFNPPPNLVKTIFVEVPMSVLQLEVGQTAVGVLTFSETTPPSDGAIASDNPAVTVSLASDMVTWTCVAVSATAANTPANVTYTGTSAPPDAGPAQVAPMAVTVIPVPVEETGDFNPGGATITGP